VVATKKDPLQLIQRPTILVTSIGRTGTEFFARLFGEILPDATCLHEPDIFQATGVDNRWQHFLGQIRRAGIWRMVILKAAGRWTLANASDARFIGRISADQARQRLLGQRRDFIEKLPGQVYMEANIGYYALLDVLPQAFREHRAIYIVRDGRDWVRSHMNWGELYGKNGPRQWISHKWPSADEMAQDPYATAWSTFSRFERICWAWARLNKYALDLLSANPWARVYKFEHIFRADGDTRGLDELVEFATTLSRIDHSRLGRTDGWLERKVHESPSGFPAWNQWTRSQRAHFEEICGPLMAELGYGLP
jgi:hypothetical protein